MFRKKHVIRISVPALAACACLAIVGCDGGSSAANALGGSGGSSPSAGSNPICVSFEQAYEAFLAGATPPDQPGNPWDELINASGKVFGSSLPSAGVGQDVFSLVNDATTTAADLSQRQPINKDVAQFNSNLKKVGKDCGTTFTPATASS